MSDFDQNASNKTKDNRKFPASGSVAGVESGLCSVESLPRGAVQPEQETIGENFRQTRTETDAGNGFKFK